MGKVFIVARGAVVSLAIAIVLAASASSARAQQTSGEKMTAYLAEYAARTNAQEGLPKDLGLGMRFEPFTSSARELALWISFTDVAREQVPADAIRDLDDAMNAMIMDVACGWDFNATALAFTVTSGEDIVVSGTYLDSSGAPITRTQVKIESAMCY